MNKVLALIFCLLGLMQLTSAAKKCTVEYYPRFDNECTPTVDEEGNIVEECTVTEVAARVFILKPNDRSENIAESVGEITFTGDCKCDYTLYANANFSGAKFRGRVNTCSSKFVPVAQIWNQAAQSWRVRCKF